ncbi:MAG: pyridoxamine 5'-phosphate oxidase family protein [Deltaproteobacteria bacterium]|nr:pyridoxamine 5'-phosphate oxidase family protein [Deltaproteobacteria bacterium]
MRRSEKEVTQPEMIAAIFAEATVCQLAFADQPAPYLVSLNYAYHDGSLYFHSAIEGRKIDRINAAQSVAFTVVRDLGIIEGGNGCNWTTRFQSVVGHGKIVLLDHLEDKRHALDIFMRHYSENDFTFPDSVINKTAVFRLDIDEMTAKQSKIDE